jgi:hypothetical protein
MFLRHARLFWKGLEAAGRKNGDGEGGQGRLAKGMSDMTTGKTKVVGGQLFAGLALLLSTRACGLALRV